MTLRTLAVLSICITGMHVCAAVAQDVQCGNDVQFTNARIEVQPSGGDDTANIQCALDEAKRLGLPLVKLLPGDFVIGTVQIVNFEGTLEGSGAENTVVAVDEALLDCQAQQDQGYGWAAGLRFVGGDAKVSRMTVGAAAPCEHLGPFLFFALVHFTGETFSEGCGINTVHGVVDRATLVSTGALAPTEGRVFGVSAARFSDCESPLLGTLKVNRSLLGGLHFAIGSQLRGSGQVDVNFNEFVNNERNVTAADASQLMTVQSNTMLKTDDLDFDHYAIQAFAFEEDSPKQSRLVVYRNRIEISQASDLELAGTGVGVARIVNGQTEFSVAVTENEFIISGGDRSLLAAITLEDVSGANIANNTFSGAGGYDSGFSHVYISGDDNTVTGNDFSGFLSLPYNVQITEQSTGNIIGPGQSAVVLDQGAGNYVLDGPPGASKPAGLPTPLLRSSSAALKTRLEQAQNRVMGVLGARIR